MSLNVDLMTETMTEGSDQVLVDEMTLIRYSLALGGGRRLLRDPRGGGVELSVQDEVPDADDPERSFHRTLWQAVKALPEDPLLAALEMFIADELHEILEWLEFDGERVFDPHSDEGVSWDAVFAAARVAAQALRPVPRRRP